MEITEIGKSALLRDTVRYYRTSRGCCVITNYNNVAGILIATGGGNEFFCQDTFHLHILAIARNPAGTPPFLIKLPITTVVQRDQGVSSTRE